MSELSREISKLKVCNIQGNPELRKQIKDAFRAGWEAREILLNKRVAEIERAATLKERDRCLKHTEYYTVNSATARNILDAIGGGK